MTDFSGEPLWSRFLQANAAQPVPCQSSEKPSSGATPRVLLPADWENREYCALDVETTGLDPFKDRVVEIGLVVFGFDRDSALVEKDAWSTLVNPEMAIPDAAYAIHGISDLDVSGSPHFAEIVGKVADYVHNRIFVAHNAPFDAAFLGNEFARLSAPSPVGDLVDTLTLARAAYPNLFSYNLGKTAYLLGIPPGQGHRALDDAKTCMQLFVRCIRTLSVFQNQ